MKNSYSPSNISEITDLLFADVISLAKYSELVQVPFISLFVLTEPLTKQLNVLI